MLFAPIDTWYIWIGITAASTVLLGVISAIPAADSPAASSAADAIDRVATSQYATVGEHPVPAGGVVRFTPETITIRTETGEQTAPLGYGPVVPATTPALRSVLAGTPPSHEFSSPTVFAEAVATSKSATPIWMDLDRIHIRRVHWESIDVTIVG